METIQGHLYDYPRYYDLVFGSDWKAEFEFLLACFAKHAGEVRRVFEPACGTGRLLYRLAKAGYQVSGLDLNGKSVDFCNARLQKHGFDESCFVADMTDFRLPQSADAAFNMINSFRHLQTEADAIEHLRCMADCLRPGGIYILGLHLTPTEAEPSEAESWSARSGHVGVVTDLHITQRDLDKREEWCAMSYDVYTPTRNFRIEDMLVFRTYTAPQMQRLIDEVDRFRVAEIYDFSYHINQPIAVTPVTEDVVYVLMRR
jgi:SAM-dependent methyltransferase